MKCARDGTHCKRVRKGCAPRMNVDVAAHDILDRAHSPLIPALIYGDQVTHADQAATLVLRRDAAIVRELALKVRLPADTDVRLLR